MQPQSNARYCQYYRTLKTGASSDTLKSELQIYRSRLPSRRAGSDQVKPVRCLCLIFGVLVLSGRLGASTIDVLPYIANAVFAGNGGDSRVQIGVSNGTLAFVNPYEGLWLYQDVTLTFAADPNFTLTYLVGRKGDQSDPVFNGGLVYQWSLSGYYGGVPSAFWVSEALTYSSGIGAYGSTSGAWLVTLNDPVSNSEPGVMVLTGSALLLLAAFMRRRGTRAARVSPTG